MSNFEVADRAKLIGSVVDDMVPELLKARLHFQTDNRDRTHKIVPGAVANIPNFANTLLLDDPEVAWESIRGLRGEGLSVQTLLLDLFTRTARHLGDRWVDDTLNFSEVTIGLCRLHQLTLELSSDFQDEVDTAIFTDRKVLLVPLPGDQHTFGLLIVAEFFRAFGWETWSDTGMTSDALEDLVAHEKFDVIGFSMSTEARLKQLTHVIQRVRKKSSNRRVGILVGGRVFIEDPRLAEMVGADLTAADAREAAVQSQLFARP